MRDTAAARGAAVAGPERSGEAVRREPALAERDAMAQGEESVVTFHRAIPQCRPPLRADRSAMGTLPTRAFRYCEAVTTASAFGWYLFAPLEFTVQWDGTDVLWTYEGAASWFPLTSAQFPGFADYFDDIAPPAIKGFSPPFLSALPEPGVLQIWTGHVVTTRPGWSLLVRPPANLPRSQSYELFEGIVETDRWFGPLFTNVRLTRTDFPIRFGRELPLLQVQPIHRSMYSEDVLGQFSFVGDLAEFTSADWEKYRATVVKPNVDPERKPGAYAVATRKRQTRDDGPTAAPDSDT
jgi:hypothetical protein